ncbi:hypothetical protein [Haloferax volcanii]|uniref:hypothetical protein n=1 Tax=Haloferax volcanii TaxID=2246 RepID=UPI001267ADCB|nr:hypothetical protein [Haloferax alexandrinus]
MEVINESLEEGATVSLGDTIHYKKLSTEFSSPRLHAICSGATGEYVTLRKVTENGDNVTFPSESTVLGTAQNTAHANTVFIWYAIPLSQYGGK